MVCNYFYGVVWRGTCLLLLVACCCWCCCARISQNLLFILSPLFLASSLSRAAAAGFSFWLFFFSIITSIYVRYVRPSVSALCVRRRVLCITFVQLLSCSTAAGKEEGLQVISTQGLPKDLNAAVFSSYHDLVFPSIVVMCNRH